MKSANNIRLIAWMLYE